MDAKVIVVRPIRDRPNRGWQATFLVPALYFWRIEDLEDSLVEYVLESLLCKGRVLDKLHSLHLLGTFSERKTGLCGKNSQATLDVDVEQRQFHHVN